MRAFGWNGTSSARAKWRSSLSACGCVLKKNLTPPTLSETRFNNSCHSGTDVTLDQAFTSRTIPIMAGFRWFIFVILVLGTVTAQTDGKQTVAVPE
jgi:hypothetical protein